VKQRLESPFHDLECRAPQLMHLELSRGSTHPRTSDSRAFLVSLGHLDVVLLDGLELQQWVDALDGQAAVAQCLLQLLDGLVWNVGILVGGLDFVGQIRVTAGSKAGDATTVARMRTFKLSKDPERDVG
jgi:hypothetical protein